MTKGGSRIGSGRKPKPFSEKKESLLISLDPQVARWLRQQPRYSRLVNNLLTMEMSRSIVRETTKNESQDSEQVRIAILSNSGGAGKSTLCWGSRSSNSVDLPNLFRLYAILWHRVD